MIRKFKQFPLEKQLFFSFFTTSALLLLITLCLTLSYDLTRHFQSLDSIISSTAGYIASQDNVVQMLERGYPDGQVTRQLDLLHQSYPELDVIAVYDREGLRFYHTSRQETGETFMSGEEEPILAGADPYITTGHGTHGSQRKAFHAIRSSDGEILGFVTVAIFSSDIFQRSLSLILAFALILCAALLTAFLLSRGLVALLKGSLRGHRPDELLDLYLRQDDLLNSIEEGLIATDPAGKVIFTNEPGRRLFQQEEDALLGKPLTQFFPESQCVCVAQDGRALHNRSLVIGERQVLASELPIRGENGYRGVLNIFQDKTEMRKLSDELSGTRYMLDTLRFFNHEFMNKLHVILGYLQTGQTQAAIQFIMNSSLVSSQSIRETADCIRAPHLCALIIGKMMHAAELGILLTVSQDSYCREEDLLLPADDCSTILGNLLENAIEELSRGQFEVKEIKLSLYCRPDCNLILCQDTGGGIDPQWLPHIWEKGRSSKGEGRGLGLYLVDQLVRQNHGTIQVDTEPGEGTCFTLTFTREEP